MENTNYSLALAAPDIYQPAAIDANALEAMAKANPDEMFLKSAGVIKLTGAIRQLERERDTLTARLKAIEDREALEAGSEESIQLKHSGAYDLRGNAAAAYDQCRIMIALCTLLSIHYRCGAMAIADRRHPVTVEMIGQSSSEFICGLFKNKQYMRIYCCGCKKDVNARLTDGREIYLHRPDLYALPFWRCDDCKNFVGCHHKTGNPTEPLGCIPTAEIKNARRHIHALIDPIWQSGKMQRSALYAEISKRAGWGYHTAKIRSIDEARTVYREIKKLLNELEDK